MAWSTAFEIIKQVAVEVGLSAPLDGSDPWTSTDSNMVQLAYMLKPCGTDLHKAHEWSQFRKEHTFTTIAGVDSYPLPDDFGGMIDQTGWNRTGRLPLGGPLSPQEWQYLKTKDVGAVFNVLFRPTMGMLYFYPSAVPGGLEIAFEYQSKNWVEPVNRALPGNPVPWIWNPLTAFAVGDKHLSGGTGSAYWLVTTAGVSGTDDPLIGVIEPVQGHTVTDGTVVWTYVADTYATAAYGLTDAPTGPLEKIWFEPNLIERKLKLHFLSEKGFDTQNAAREFEVALSTAIGEDSASPVLNPNRPTVGLSPLLGEGSIPITGFGV